MTKKHFEAAAAYVRHYRFWNPGERDQVTEAFVAVFREFNPRFDADRFRAACRGEDATDSAGRTVRYASQPADRTPVGTCPACRETVYADDPDGPVWTCPADLSPKNPFWEPDISGVTDDERERCGVFSCCGEDYGRGCYDRLPLHSTCYDKGDY